MYLLAGAGVAALVVAVLPFDGSTLVGDAVRTCIAAVIVAIAYGCAPLENGAVAWSRPSSGTALTWLVVAALVLYAGGMCAWGFGSAAGEAAQPAMDAAALFALSCVATGVFEECLFRGLMFEGFLVADRGTAPRLTTVQAAMATSIVFAVFHAFGTLGFPFALWGAWGHVAKAVEALVFSLALCWLRTRGLSVWHLAVLHAVFDVLYFAPALALGAFPLAVA